MTIWTCYPDTYLYVIPQETANRWRRDLIKVRLIISACDCVQKRLREIDTACSRAGSKQGGSRHKAAFDVARPINRPAWQWQQRQSPAGASACLGWAPFDLWLAAVKAADAPRPTDDDVSRHKRAGERRLFWSAAMRKEIIGMAATRGVGAEGGRGHHYEGIVRCCEDFRLTHD